MYWDYAATTPVKPEVVEAMMPYLKENWYNPSAAYEPAMQVRRDVEAARARIAQEINADPDEIYFTSSGSEANSWVLQSFGSRNIVITSTIEHHSIEQYKNQKYLTKVPVDDCGLLDLDLLHQSVQQPLGVGILASVQMANNEIGAIQNYETIASIVHINNGFFHTDAVQAFGKIPVDVKKMGIDMLSASGHKIGAPKGIGFLYVRRGIPFSPMILGSQELGMRGGTENVPYIIGMAKAVDLIDYTVQERLKEKYEYMVGKALKFATMNKAPAGHQLYNILSMTIDAEVDGNMLLGMLHDRGQFVSAGSACMAHNPEPSHVLKAIGLTDEEASRTLRISLSDNVTYEDIDKLLADIQDCIEFLKGWT